MIGCEVLVLSGYIGPGAGLGLVGALFAVFAAICAALFFVAAWPVRILLRKLNKRGRGDDQIPVEGVRPVA